jgi:hypothetical protein
MASSESPGQAGLPEQPVSADLSRLPGPDTPILSVLPRCHVQADLSGHAVLADLPGLTVYANMSWLDVQNVQTNLFVLDVQSQPS